MKSLLFAALLAAAPTPADLDKLLAPVALYPDALLAQMLLCTADPPKVIELRDWLAKNPTLKGTELQDAATVAGFEPSFVAMALFPQVVNDMAQRKEWTAELGKQFAADKAAVFDSIQRLRKQASEAGTLKTTQQQEVETKTTSAGQQVIVIEPANPQVIYVPTYNPTTVYAPPTTVVVQDDDDSDAIAAGVIGFAAGIALGAAVDNDYYYGPWGWHGGGYMYNDAWDDYYDAREDAREDWMDHREDLVEERGERAGDAREQRTERTESRQDGRTERTEGRQDTRSATGDRAATGQRTTQSQQASQPRTTTATRGYDSPSARTTTSGQRSDAMSGYSSGRSTRAESARGQSSRGSSRGGAARSSGGGGGRRR